MLESLRFGAVVIGASAGGLSALQIVLAALPKDFVAPVLIVQHFPVDAVMRLTRLLAPGCMLPIEEAVDKAQIEGGHIYIAPPGYHLLVEPERTMALCADDPVNWSKPSIDLLFDSASQVYRDALVGVLLTGANADGAQGLRRIKERGGLAFVQDPATAEAAAMPNAAISATTVDIVASLEKIGALLARGAMRLTL